jgi:hypothetical protein
LYWIDRVITCSVRILNRNQSQALVRQSLQYGTNESDGVIIETTNNQSKTILQHRPIYLPNGALFNPPNPIQTIDGTNTLRTNVFSTSLAQSAYYTAAGMMVHVEPIISIPSYIAPTLQILRQDLLA